MICQPYFQQQIQLNYTLQLYQLLLAYQSQMSGTRNIIQLRTVTPIKPIVSHENLLQRSNDNVYQLKKEQLEQLYGMLDDPSNPKYNDELDPRERQNTLRLITSRLIELQTLSAASLEKDKQKYKILIKQQQAEDLKKEQQACAKCFLKKFDAIFAICLMILCLAAAMIANWVVEKLGNQLNSQIVLVIIGGCLVAWIFVIFCINRSHTHSKQKPSQPQSQLGEGSELQSSRVRDIIQHRIEKQCFILLLSGQKEQIERISLSQIPYLQKIISLCQAHISEIGICVDVLDQLFLRKTREKIQRLNAEVLGLKNNYNQLKDQKSLKYQCDQCFKCLISSNTSIFVVLSAIIAIGITEVTAWVGSPLKTTWSTTWAIKIIFILLFVTLLCQMLYRNCRSKTPYYH